MLGILPPRSGTKWTVYYMTGEECFSIDVDEESEAQRIAVFIRRHGTAPLDCSK